MKSLIPEAALAQHAIVLGKTRSGKSAKMRLLVEGLLHAGKPVCIIDPKGDWWGIKSSADGKHDGYPVVIFGGKHADVPINAKSGAAIAELVATGNRPSLIDLQGWRVSDRTQFFIDFAQAFFNHSTGIRHLVIDEVHNFCPKGKIFSPQAGEMLHWSNTLATEGQGKGIILVAASQRPQRVHNDFLTSCETLIACRMIHKADREAVKDWIDGCADIAVGKEVLATLANMSRPEAWVWSPEIDFGPKRLTFPLFETFDSFKPQGINQGKLKGWAEVDLDEVTATLAAVVEEAKANDPKALRAQIVELERAKAGVEARLAEVVSNQIAADPVACYEEGWADARLESAKIMNELRSRLEGVCHSFMVSFGGMAQIPQRPRPEVIARKIPKRVAPPVQSALEPRKPPKRVTREEWDAKKAGREFKKIATKDVSPSAQKIIEAIHRAHPIALTYAAAARRAGISNKSSAYRSYLKEVRESPQVNVIPSPTGDSFRSAMDSPPAGGKGPEGIDVWVSKLPPTYGRMLRVVKEHGPIAKDGIAGIAGVSPTSSGLNVGLKSLVDLDLITREHDGTYSISEGL